jgi:hypothetical protein
LAPGSLNPGREEGEEGHLDQAAIVKKQQLSIFPEPHRGCFDNRLYEVDVVNHNLPVFLPGDPRF